MTSTSLCGAHLRPNLRRGRNKHLTPYLSISRSVAKSTARAHSTTCARQDTLRVPHCILLATSDRLGPVPPVCSLCIVFYGLQRGGTEESRATLLKQS